MPLENLPDDDLQKIAKGDIEGLSDLGLKEIVGGDSSKSNFPPGSDQQDTGERDIAISLARAIFGSGGSPLKAAGSMAGSLVEKGLETPQAEMQLEGLPGLVELGKGIKEGVRREDTPQDSTLPRDMGRAIGKFGPRVIGGVAGAAVTSGASLLPTALAVGAGAGGGELLGLGGSNIFGGKKSTLKGAVKEAGKVGLEAALLETGIGVVGKVAAKVFPTAAQVFLRTPAESIKRAIEKPEIIPALGNAARVEVERKGINSLKSVTDMVERARNMAGNAVENALKGLHSKTGGKPVADLTDVVANTEGTILNMTRNAVDDELVGKDLAQITRVVEAMKKKLNINARELVENRRNIDDLVTFKEGRVPKVTTSAGEKVAKQLAHDYRELISKVGKDQNFPILAEKNKLFSDTAKAYDELRPRISTKNKSDEALLEKLNELTRAYNEGGLSTELVKDLGSKIPGWGSMFEKEIGNLTDSIAARAFTRLPQGTPSSMVKDFFRLLVSPATGKGLKIANAPATKKAVRAGGQVVAPEFTGD